MIRGNFSVPRDNNIVDRIPYSMRASNNQQHVFESTKEYKLDFGSILWLGI